MTKDPVCGMTVEPAKAAASFDFEGTTYFFCCEHCRKAFQADPREYLNSSAPAGCGCAGGHCSR